MKKIFENVFLACAQITLICAQDHCSYISTAILYERSHPSSRAVRRPICPIETKPIAAVSRLSLFSSRLRRATVAHSSSLLSLSTALSSISGECRCPLSLSIDASPSPFSGQWLGALSLSLSTSTSPSPVYRTKIPTKSPKYPYASLPFSTSFIFSISPVDGYEPDHGLAFLLTASPDTNSSTFSQHLALFNGTNNGDQQNHVLAVEFDVFQNPEFGDINNNHVGVDINSLSSVAANTSGFVDPSSGSFVELPLNTRENYQVWIDYNDLRLSFTMAPAG